MHFWKEGLIPCHFEPCKIVPLKKKFDVSADTVQGNPIQAIITYRVVEDFGSGWIALMVSETKQLFTIKISHDDCKFNKCGTNDIRSTSDFREIFETLKWCFVNIY